jgi:hypothetical protein
MAFDLQNLARASAAMNTGMVIAEGTQVAGPTYFSYRSAVDNAAAIAGADYFADAIFQLAVGDLIYVVATDASNFLQVATVDRSAGTITTVSFGASGVVGTANIQDGAVTTAKLDDEAVTTAKIEDDAVTTAKLDDNAVTSGKLSVNVIQQAQVAVDASEWKGMYATPKELVAAPGANLQHVLLSAKILLDYGTTQYADGGAVFVQYDSTANGTGTKASETIAAAGFNAAVADSTAQLTGTQAVAAASTTVNKSLCLTNDTGAFTAGDSTFKVDVWYSTVSYA